MAPLIQKLIGSGVRYVLTAVSAAAGAATPSDDVVQKITLEYVIPLLMLAWSWYKERRNQQKLNVSLATPQVMSEHELENVIKSTEAHKLPSVLTPKTDVPQ